MKEIKLKAEWIWASKNDLKDDKVIFRKNFDLSHTVNSAIAYIAVDTKYWLYVNGKLIVFEGGLFRESMPSCGYADQIDLAPYLQIGKNVVALLCWFFGNQGRNNIDSTEAGLIFQCEALDLYSNESFKSLRHPAYYATSEPTPAYLYGGYNIGFNATLDIGDYTAIEFDESGWENAKTFKNNNWGQLYERPVPQIRTTTIKMSEAITKKNNEYIVNLPHAMAYSPYIELNAKGGEIIRICSDRYTINGGPGDEYNAYNGHRIEYICHAGKNSFESILYIFGEKILVSFDQPVDIYGIGYRETGYDCDIVGQFECDCEITNRLVEKAARTLYVCMRDNFMDCPDRERGQWIGDVSVQVPQTFFLLSESATLLVKKAISDFINLRKGDVLVGNVPGANFSELPAQSLNAISEIGLIAEYYKYTGDKSSIELAFEPAIKYLQLWDIGENGLVVGRSGNWGWFDHLYNIDEAVLENAWYYSALQFACKMADILNDHRFDAWLEDRKVSIENNFERYFWKGTFYSSGSFVDDRANAMAMLSGLCKKENHQHIRKILISVFNATVYMENYVLIALCEMGYIEDAYKRMVSRYYNLAMNENSTLWEDFYILGTKNHAWSGSPASIAFRYFVGIDTADGYKSFSVKPVKNLFRKMYCRFNIKNGYVVIKVTEGEVFVDNCSDSILLNEKE